MATQEQMPAQRVVGLEEWAREVGVGRTTAYKLARKGEIPGLFRLGRRYLISRAAMDRMLDGRGQLKEQRR